MEQFGHLHWSTFPVFKFPRMKTHKKTFTFLGTLVPLNRLYQLNINESPILGIKEITKIQPHLLSVQDLESSILEGHFASRRLWSAIHSRVTLSVKFLLKVFTHPLEETNQHWLIRLSFGEAILNNKVVLWRNNIEYSWEGSFEGSITNPHILPEQDFINLSKVDFKPFLSYIKKEFNFFFWVLIFPYRFK